MGNAASREKLGGSRLFGVAALSDLCTNPPMRNAGSQKATTQQRKQRRTSVSLKLNKDVLASRLFLFFLQITISDAFAEIIQKNKQCSDQAGWKRVGLSHESIP